MSEKKNTMNEVLSKKIDLLLKFRGYKQESEEEGKNMKDCVIVKKGEDLKLLLRIIYKTTLVSGKVGVHYIRKLKEKINKEGFDGSIIIGKGFSYSARSEAEDNNIEAIEQAKIPAFNIFEHELVPEHNILSEKDAEKLLEKYHVKRYQIPQIKSSDPAVFLIGANRGDIIKITRKSPTAGIHETYRHVV